MRRYFLHQEILVTRQDASDGSINEDLDVLIYFDEYKVMETELGKEEFPVAPVFAVIELLKKDIKYVKEDKVYIFSDTLTKESFDTFLKLTEEDKVEAGDQEKDFFYGDEMYYFHKQEEHTSRIVTIRDSVTFLPFRDCFDVDVMARMESLIDFYTNKRRASTLDVHPLLFTGTQEDYREFLANN